MSETDWCCISGFRISIPIYLVVQGFAKGIPAQVHPTVFPLFGAIVVLLSVLLILAGVVFAILCDKTCKGTDIGSCGAICGWFRAFFLGGLCSFIGGILMFAAAAFLLLHKTNIRQGLLPTWHLQSSLAYWQLLQVSFTAVQWLAIF